MPGLINNENRLLWRAVGYMDVGRLYNVLWSYIYIWDRQPVRWASSFTFHRSPFALLVPTFPPATSPSLFFSVSSCWTRGCSSPRPCFLMLSESNFHGMERWGHWRGWHQAWSCTQHDTIKLSWWSGWELLFHSRAVTQSVGGRS